jgi:hypothetical protein
MLQSDTTTFNKVQITNIGGQTLPVIQGILEFPCSLNILLHSNESAQAAKKIADLIDAKCQLMPMNDANDYYGILDCIEKIVSDHPQTTFFVNVSGGTKIMTLALHTFFIQRNLSSTIFHIDQNGMIHYLTEMKTEPLKTTLPIEQFIAFSGQKVKSKTRVEDIPIEFFEAKNKVKKIFAQYSQEFRYLCDAYRKTGRKDSNYNDFELINPKSYSQVKWNKEEDELTLSIKRKYKIGYDEYSFIGHEYIGIVLETKWFELELVEIFRNWNKTRELAWSVVVPYIEGSDKNEIDVVVNLGNKLLFVEGKTHVADIKDIDKFRNAAKTYGGLGAKAILITWHEPNKRIIEKCNDNNILLFSFTNPDKNINNGNDLYRMLNNEISKSNTF